MTKNPSLIMGVVNLTPDSFSDGGAFLRDEDAYRFALQLMEDGADIIDIGAESSRPGALSIDVQTEWSRLESILKRLQNRPSHMKLSVDTCKPEIMLKACEFGVDYINDINGAVEGDYLSKLSLQFPKLSYIAMHKHGQSLDMQKNPLKSLEPVEVFFNETSARLKAHGFRSENIWLDPGIGFGKTDTLNWQLLAASSEFAKSYNLTVGVSRKSFIGRWLGIEKPIERDHASKALEASLMLAGVGIVRTHTPGPLAKLRKTWKGQHYE